MSSRPVNNRPVDFADAYTALENFVRAIVLAKGSRFSRGDLMYLALDWVREQLECMGEPALATKIERLCDQFNALPLVDREWLPQEAN
jgi:hypothetical protein